MNYSAKIPIIVILFISSILYIASCKKKSTLPIVTTTNVTGITQTTATSGGNVKSDGGAEVTARGVCWGASTGPTITGSKTIDSKGTGSFTSSLTGLTENTKYYVRAYATNNEGTTYGDEVNFTTSQVVAATLTTAIVSSITSTSAVSGGTVSADGGGSVTVRGVCWATTANPTVSGSKTTDGAGTGTFASNLAGLTPGVLYHVRAYATNSLGTAYGNDLTFTTLSTVPVLTTIAVTGITSVAAVSGGNVTSDGGSAVTGRGACWNTTANPIVTDSHTSDGTGVGTFTSNLTGLLPNTTYHVRAYATNNLGTAYGDEKIFTTVSTIPNQIIADHTIVADFDKIPAYYINLVKTMYFDYVGESHATGVLWGLDNFASQNPTYATNFTQTGAPEAYTTAHLRVGWVAWGTYDVASGWVSNSGNGPGYGEEDWWTNSTAIARTEAGLSYMNSIGVAPTAFGFGWCADLEYNTGSVSSIPDPVYGCHWYGMSAASPSGNRCWGLDDADNAITGNVVNMDTYLSVTQGYNDYCTAHNIPTKVIFTTGPVNWGPGDDGTQYTTEQEYSGYLKNEHIRNYVKANSSRILFDYGDILCYDDDGTAGTMTWNGHTFPHITAKNRGSQTIGHIDMVGCIRCAKAIWWMLARMAGWDGGK
jgi:hypothetical protein